MTARFLRLFTFPGSTVFRENAASRGGISGGRGALEALCPIDASFPVRKRFTASRVRWTFGGGLMIVVNHNYRNAVQILYL